MKIGVIVSKKIEKDFRLQANQLLKDKGIPVIEIEDYPLYMTDKDVEKYDADYFVAISIHSLKDAPKRFCVHPCGNWNEKWPRYHTDLGGEEKTLCMHSASFLKFIYNSLQKHNTLSEYKISIEATHHGPELSRPILMLEIGSFTEAWQDIEANKIVVRVAEDILQNFSPTAAKACIVLGGDHYMQRIAPLLSKDNFAVSHMCPSSQMHNFTEGMLLEAIQKSYGGVDKIIMDVAGVGQHYERIVNMLKKNNIPFIHLHELI